MIPTTDMNGRTEGANRTIHEYLFGILCCTLTQFQQQQTTLVFVMTVILKLVPACVELLHSLGKMMMMLPVVMLTLPR